MLHARWLICCLVLATLGFGVSIRSAFSSAQETDECAGINVYVQGFARIADQLEEQNLDIDDLETWTSNDFIAASEILNAIRSELDVTEPPSIAVSYHETLTKLLGAFSQMFDAMSVAGIFGALPYTETLEELDADLADTALEVELACNVALYDHDNDDVQEIGLGGLAAGSPEPASLEESSTGAGSRIDPIPIGASAALDENWEIAVLGVIPDATESVLNEIDWNDPPQPGHQFFLARVLLRYSGSESDEFGARLRLSAVGDSAVGYTMYDNGCGTISDELPDPEMFTGGRIEGNICWSVRTEDAYSLVMYDNDVDRDDRVFLSLIPTEPRHWLQIGVSEREGEETVMSSPVTAPHSSPVASITATPSPGASPNAADTATIVSGDIFFEPTEHTIVADTDVTFMLPNEGLAPHNFSIDELEIDINIAPGAEEDVVINAAAGEYEYYCNVPGHREAGMVGTLVVE